MNKNIYCEPPSCGVKLSYLYFEIQKYISCEIRMLIFFQMSGLKDLENILYLISL